MSTATGNPPVSASTRAPASTTTKPPLQVENLRTSGHKSVVIALPQAAGRFLANLGKRLVGKAPAVQEERTKTDLDRMAEEVSSLPSASVGAQRSGKASFFGLVKSWGAMWSSGRQPTTYNSKFTPHDQQTNEKTLNTNDLQKIATKAKTSTTQGTIEIQKRALGIFNKELRRENAQGDSAAQVPQAQAASDATSYKNVVENRNKLSKAALEAISKGLLELVVEEPTAQSQHFHKTVEEALKALRGIIPNDKHMSSPTARVRAVFDMFQGNPGELAKHDLAVKIWLQCLMIPAGRELLQKTGWFNVYDGGRGLLAEEWKHLETMAKAVLHFPGCRANDFNSIKTACNNISGKSGAKCLDQNAFCDKHRKKKHLKSPEDINNMDKAFLATAFATANTMLKKLAMHAYRGDSDTSMHAGRLHQCYGLVEPVHGTAAAKGQEGLPGLWAANLVVNGIFSFSSLILKDALPHVGKIESAVARTINPLYTGRFSKFLVETRERFTRGGKRPLDNVKSGSVGMGASATHSNGYESREITEFTNLFSQLGDFYALSTGCQTAKLDMLADRIPPQDREEVSKANQALLKIYRDQVKQAVTIMSVHSRAMATTGLANPNAEEVYLEKDKNKNEQQQEKQHLQQKEDLIETLLYGVRYLPEVLSEPDENIFSALLGADWRNINGLGDAVDAVEKSKNIDALEEWLRSPVDNDTKITRVEIITAALDKSHHARTDLRKFAYMAQQVAVSRVLDHVAERFTFDNSTEFGTISHTANEMLARVRYMARYMHKQCKPFTKSPGAEPYDRFHESDSLVKKQRDSMKHFKPLNIAAVMNYIDKRRNDVLDNFSLIDMIGVMKKLDDNLAPSHHVAMKRSWQGKAWRALRGKDMHYYGRVSGRRPQRGATNVTHGKGNAGSLESQAIQHEKWKKAAHKFYHDQRQSPDEVYMAIKAQLFSDIDNFFKGSRSVFSQQAGIGVSAKVGVPIEPSAKMIASILTMSVTGLKGRVLEIAHLPGALEIKFGHQKGHSAGVNGGVALTKLDGTEDGSKRVGVGVTVLTAEEKLMDYQGVAIRVPYADPGDGTCIAQAREQLKAIVDTLLIQAREMDSKPAARENIRKWGHVDKAAAKQNPAADELVQGEELTRCVLALLGSSISCSLSTFGIGDGVEHSQKLSLGPSVGANIGTLSIPGTPLQGGAAASAGIAATWQQNTKMIKENMVPGESGLVSVIRTTTSKLRNVSVFAGAAAGISSKVPVGDGSFNNVPDTVSYSDELTFLRNGMSTRFQVMLINNLMTEDSYFDRVFEVRGQFEAYVQKEWLSMVAFHAKEQAEYFLMKNPIPTNPKGKDDHKKLFDAHIERAVENIQGRMNEAQKRIRDYKHDKLNNDMCIRYELNMDAGLAVNYLTSLLAVKHTQLKQLELGQPNIDPTKIKKEIAKLTEERLQLMNNPESYVPRWLLAVEKESFSDGNGLSSPTPFVSINFTKEATSTGNRLVEYEPRHGCKPGEVTRVFNTWLERLGAENSEALQGTYIQYLNDAMEIAAKKCETKPQQGGQQNTPAAQGNAQVAQITPPAAAPINLQPA